MGPEARWDEDLAYVVGRWPALSPEERALIVGIAQGGT